MKVSEGVLEAVYEYYAALKDQPKDCQQCAYLYDIPWNEPIPDGYSRVRGARGYIKQCPEHDRPAHPWLHGPSREAAMAWLKEELANQPGPFMVNFEKWKAFTNERSG